MGCSFAVFFIVTLFTINSGDALQCYSCSSNMNATCMEGDKLGSFQTECNDKAMKEFEKSITLITHKSPEWANLAGVSSGGKPTVETETICQRVDIESKTKDKEETHTLRNCFTLKKGSDFCEWMKSKVTGDTVKVKFCSQCSDNLCNSSTGIAPTIFTIFTPIVAVLFHKISFINVYNNYIELLK